VPAGAVYRRAVLIRDNRDELVAVPFDVGSAPATS